MKLHRISACFHRDPLRLAGAKIPRAVSGGGPWMPVADGQWKEGAGPGSNGIHPLCSTESWNHGFTIGISSPFMAIMQISEFTMIYPDRWVSRIAMGCYGKVFVNGDVHGKAIWTWTTSHGHV